MRKNTDRKKLAAIVCTLAVVVVMASYLAVLLFALLSERTTPAVVCLLLGVYSLLILAAVVGVFTALRQRLKEIDKGEEEDASQY